MADTLVKICGLQDVEVLKSMVHLPVDYIGFVFAPSRRRVTVESAEKLVAELKGWRTEVVPRSAGVFVNPEITELRELLSRVPLDVVQLHGEERPEFCCEVKEAFPQVQVWKAISVIAKDSNKAETRLGIQDYAGSVHAILLDTYDPEQKGGSGRTFAWADIPHYKEQADAAGIPLFVAGGLHPDNVEELLEGYAPDGVDVSSGVETNGVKDIAKMTVFVERVKQS